MSLHNQSLYMTNSRTSLAKTLLQVASHNASQVHLQEKLEIPRRQIGSSIHSPPGGKRGKEMD